MITVDDQLTARAIEYSFRQRHLLPMPTPAACLTGRGRVDLHKHPASLFRFAGQLIEEFRPGRVTNAFGQTMVMGHALDMQVLYEDDPKPINDLTAFLMCEVVALEDNPFMNTGHNFALLCALFCPLLKLGEFTLHTSQISFFLTEKARVRNLFASREGRKGLESHINPHLGRYTGQAFGFALHRERHIPFTSGGTLDGTRFDPALDGAVVDHFDGANLGEADAVIMRDAETRLRKGERVVSVSPPKAREARLLCCLDATKERFKGQIDTHRHILQDLGVDDRERWAFLFQDRERIDLPVAGQALALLLIGSLPRFKQMVVEPPTFIKSFVELLNLLPGWIGAILKHFMHGCMIAQDRTDVKRRGITQTKPQVRNAASIPMAEARGFMPRLYKALLTTLIEESNSDDEYDKHLLVVANLQRNTANGLLGTLDTELHDDLTRLSDRVIRFKHLEDGIFI